MSDYSGVRGTCSITIIVQTTFVVAARFLPIAYGGVHLSAWHFFFPTEIEGMLWKIACVSIMAAFPLWFLLVFIVFRVEAACGVEIISDSKWFKARRPFLGRPTNSITDAA
jgi:hypothetical protein